ncbi:MAG TPA: ketopantoate reductase family protein [Acidisphaera sp.]|nr:ketopantoate reductase family protein [Acidisphaera sp.]
MRTLVVGAGATGGFFGGRMLQAGRDVTFLVRPARAAALARTGLVIRSSSGESVLPNPPTVTAASPGSGYDVVLFGCKAYDLDAAINDVAGAVGPATAIIPLLNGMRHLDALIARFGDDRVLGGLCQIAAMLAPDGAVVQMGEMASNLVFGERAGGMSERVRAIAAEMAGAAFASRASDIIVQEMWEKWVMLATLAAATCLMRATVGDIVTSGAADLTLGLLDEVAAIAAACGYPPREERMKHMRMFLSASASPMTASMLRDIEGRGRIEADYILGDLLARRPGGGGGEGDASLLRIAYAHTRAYEARRAREAKKAN